MLGLGFGVLLASPLERFALFLIVLGVLLHGFVLLERPTPRQEGSRPPLWWSVLYWLTWMAMALASSRACA